MAEKKKKSKKPKKSVSYSSSEGVGRGFDTALPAEQEISYLRKKSPFGKASPRAAGMSGVSHLIDLFSDEDTARGRRHARNIAKELVKQGKYPRKKSGGSVGRGMGAALRGGGIVTKG